MPCRKLARKARPPILPLNVCCLFAAMLALGLACCSGHPVSFDPPQRNDANGPPVRIGAGNKPQRKNEDDTPGLPSRLLANLLGVNTSKTKNDGGAAPGPHLFCPEIIIPEDAAASRVYAGTPPSNANLRYQFGLTETARECALEGDQLALKIGVAGKVLLGPAGSAGSFTVPVRMTILRKSDDEQILAKLYHAAVNIGQNGTEAEFMIVSEPLRVPFLQKHAEEDYTIRVEIGEAPAKNEQPRKGAKR